MKTLALFLFGIACGLSLFGCAGGDPTVPQRESSVDDARLRRQEQWQQILTNPGTPGVDYHPARITVSYRAGSTLPASTLAGQPPLGQRAAEQRNAMLRVDRSYEVLTDAIAAGFGLKIESQVYNTAVHFASFSVPDSANAASVLSGIRQQFAGSIEWATYTRLTHALFIPNDPDYLSSTDTSGPQWHLHKLHCADAWDVTFGSEDVRIAVLDTGANLTHEELAGQVLDPEVVFPEASCDPGEGDNDVTDTYGHGSGCSGMAVAANNNGLTTSGVAPGSRVIPIKVVDQNNWFLMDAVVEGGYLAAALGARILSMSYGSTFPDPLEEAMCDDLHAQGLLLCASAGNSDSTDPMYPADYESCFTVGATNIDDARISHPGWWGSEYGPGVEIAAPGEDYNSANMGGPSDYQDFGGTSGAAPQVAAAAALAWTIHPDWTHDEVRDALIETGMPTTGFLTSIPRVDVGNFILQYSNGYRLPPDPRLIRHGVLQLVPEVFGTGLQTLSAYLNDELVQQTSSAPWELGVSTNAVLFDMARLKVEGVVDGNTRSSETTLIIDNSPSASALYASCDELTSDLLAVDVKALSGPAVASLRQLPSAWNLAQLKAAGSGNWQVVTEGAFKQGSFFCGLPQGGYDAYELDVLLLRKLDLSLVSSPSLSFMHHYNLEDGGAGFDRAYVLVSEDEGLSWEPATRRDGTLAEFTGYLPDWTLAEIDLTEYSGQIVHVALSLQSDKSIAGENLEAAGGWWVDEIQVSSNFQPLARCEAALPAAFTVAGSVAGRLSLGSQIINPEGVTSVEYVLDCAPLGTTSPDDVFASGTPGEEVQLPVPMVQNQVAQLRVTCLGPGGPGQVISIPVALFNQLGDCNLDGQVSLADFELLTQSLGKSTGEPGYSPFLDPDLDGKVTEADASAIGYGWGSAL